MKELVIGIFKKKMDNPRVLIVHDPIVIDYNDLAIEERGFVISYANNLVQEIKDGKIIFTLAGS